MMGTTVVIDHDGGYQTTYANLQATPTVQEGDTVIVVSTRRGMNDLQDIFLLQEAR